MTTVQSTDASARRAIFIISTAGFAGQAMIRTMDSLLPQVAHDFGTTAGTASIVVTVYGLAYAVSQLVFGPAGDRFGKFQLVSLSCAVASVLVFVSGLMPTLNALAAVRLITGLVLGGVVPLGMAYVGDVTPFAQRQVALGRFFTGVITGQMFGQAAGGVLGEWIGWRGMFFVMAGVFLASAVAMGWEMARNPRAREKPPRQNRHYLADYATVLGNRWALVILAVAALESFLLYGGFAYIGADLHARLGLDYATIGIVVAAFAVGGLIYATAMARIANRLGHPTLALIGGTALFAGFMLLALGGAWWIGMMGSFCVGYGFFTLHSALQMHATQMTPDARSTAVALFSSAIFLSQAIGVAMAAPIVDRYGAPPVFLISGVGLLALAVAFSVLLRGWAKRMRVAL